MSKCGSLFDHSMTKMLTRGSAPRPRWELPLQIPVRRSRSTRSPSPPSEAPTLKSLDSPLYWWIWSTLVTLNHSTFNHATVNHRLAIDCVLSNLHIKTWCSGGFSIRTCTRTCMVNDSAIFPIKNGLIMKRGSGYCKQNKMQLMQFKIGISVCRHFSIVTIQQLRTFVQGIKKDHQMQHSSFLQGIAGAQPSVT